MNLYEDGLSHLFGLNPRKKVLKRVVAWTLAIAFVTTPITFRHALWDYIQRKSTKSVSQVLTPALNQLNANLDEQMRKAQQLQKAKQLQQQKVQSGHK